MRRLYDHIYVGNVDDHVAALAAGRGGAVSSLRGTSGGVRLARRGHVHGEGGSGRRGWDGRSRLEVGRRGGPVQEQRAEPTRPTRTGRGRWK